MGIRMKKNAAFINFPILMERLFSFFSMFTNAKIIDQSNIVIQIVLNQLNLFYLTLTRRHYPCKGKQ